MFSVSCNIFTERSVRLRAHSNIQIFFHFCWTGFHRNKQAHGSVSIEYATRYVYRLRYELVLIEFIVTLLNQLHTQNRGHLFRAWCCDTQMSINCFVPVESYSRCDSEFSCLISWISALLEMKTLSTIWSVLSVFSSLRANESQESNNSDKVTQCVLRYLKMQPQ